MKFVMHRDRVVASTKGHSVRFEKGVPTHVPPELYDEVMAVGAVPEEEIPEEERTAKTVEPTDPTEREKALFATFEAMILRGRREDFSAGGAPHGKALAVELGWPVPNKERDQAWAKFRAEKDE